jgi:hypothetical protein
MFYELSEKCTSSLYINFHAASHSRRVAFLSSICSRLLKSLNLLLLIDVISSNNNNNKKLQDMSIYRHSCYVMMICVQILNTYVERDCRIEYNNTAITQNTSTFLFSKLNAFNRFILYFLLRLTLATI